MHSVKDTKEESIRLSRELADACREIIEVKFAFEILSNKLKSTEVAFAQFLFDNKIVPNIGDAKKYVDVYVSEIMNPPKQLSLDFSKKKGITSV